ncbi:MAG TPA: helix-turn-helix transcriptional regulator [Pseudonocardiaceae bacterium]|jgi:transcriptional regulator with XRE-family HTH domain|nr:helix-turn-helix transcriptional regulator [Pseudonocardiaceae bacterium]
MARTPKAQALGAMLRQARKDKGIVLDELGAAIHRDIGTISRWENGERTPKPEQVAQILTRLDVHGVRYDEIMTLAYGTNESQWVATTLPELRQQMAAYIDWEQRATSIVEVDPLMVPGLLQTTSYIKAVMTAGGVPAGEIASRIASRIGRREVLEKPKPARLLLLLGQGALNQDVGGQEVTVEQIHHILTMATRPNIDVRIIPEHRGWHPGLEGPFALIEANRSATHGNTVAPAPRQLSSIVFVGTRRSVLMLHEDADVGTYREAIHRIMQVTLTAEASLNYIADLGKRLERNDDRRSHLAKGPSKPK